MEFLTSQKTQTNQQVSKSLKLLYIQHILYIYIYISLSLSLFHWTWRIDVPTSQPSQWRVSTRFSQLWTKAIRFSSRFPRGHVVPLLAQRQHRSPSCAPAVRGIQSLILPFGKGSEPLSVYIILYIYTVCVCAHQMYVLYCFIICGLTTWAVFKKHHLIPLYVLVDRSSHRGSYYKIIMHPSGPEVSAAENSYKSSKIWLFREGMTTRKPYIWLTRPWVSCRFSMNQPSEEKRGVPEPSKLSGLGPFLRWGYPGRTY